MRTVDEALTFAPPSLCFRVAADVERWPEILPHYRWVRFRERRGFAEGVVEMAAWRPFPGLRWPTWWVSEMTHDPRRRTVQYRHIDGITRGMEVSWEVREEAPGRTRLRIVHEWRGPGWPLIGPTAARWIIGPHFVSHIAGRTLAGVVREAESREEAGNEVDGVGGADEAATGRADG
jgi:ribosome-associated toxin RatA of RatAB toxin-antitoxin module